MSETDPAPPPTNLRAMAPDDVYAALATTPAGLTEEQARARLARHGPNRLTELPGPSLIGRLLGQFVHLFALLLWAGAALALLAGLPSLAIAIVVVIVLNGAFGFLQEYRAERAVAALRRLLPQEVVVVRNGDERRVAAESLVPGDIVVLTEGDRVSADGRLVEAEDLRLDDSSLTGESHPVYKTAHPEREPGIPLVHARNVVFAGSTVVSGAGKAAVTATGMATEFGRIAQLTQVVRAAPSPLQIEVDRVARRVAALSVAMGGLFFAIGWLFAGLTLRDGAIFGIGIVLGNVPEGLLPTMTLALAMGVQRMARRNAIVKSLPAVETLGACTVICTDKTGTITSNEMTVREVWADGARVTLTGSGYAPDGALEADGCPVDDRSLASFSLPLRIGHLCNAAHLRPPSHPGGQWQVLGDPTEVALLVAARKASLDRDRDLRQRPLARSLAFDPRRKRMSTIHCEAAAGVLVAYVKGAPVELLAHCARAVRDGREVLLTEELRAGVLRENDRMAGAGMRVLAMAYRPLPSMDAAQVRALAPGDVERDLVFAGLIGMLDPPRPEVATAVRRCRAAGIRVLMITGDYGLTAEAIARRVGILGEGTAELVDGSLLDTMPDESLRRVVASGTPIFARVTPEHKLRVVAALQSLGEVVAVTGDGVNDAPALKQADIGVAMGRIGTDVAREAADVVLADDNFATIVAAVEEGRAIFDNMRKFIVYIFAHLAPEAIPFVFFALAHCPLPLTVMQILAIDLGTETLPALALGVERPEPDVMARPPRRRTERLLDAGALVRGYGFLGLLTSAVVLVAFFLYLHSVGWSWGQGQAPTMRAGAEATTIVFIGIVVMQVGNAFACRTERVSALSVGFLSNSFLLWGIAFELAFAAALVYVPALQSLFGTAPVELRWWLAFGAGVPAAFALEEARKALARKRHAPRARAK